ncbi:MAG: hypothetical protein QM760_20250 [Nibricoccus sp.]
MNMIMKYTRHLMVLAALVFSSALSLKAISQNVGYVSYGMTFYFSANTDAEAYIKNLDTNEVIGRAYYDYFTGAQVEIYAEGVSGNAWGQDAAEIYDLPPGNYQLELWGGPFGSSGFSDGYGAATFYYASPYGGYVWASYIGFSVN